MSIGCFSRLDTQWHHVQRLGLYGKIGDDTELLRERLDILSCYAFDVEVDLDVLRLGIDYRQKDVVVRTGGKTSSVLDVEAELRWLGQSVAC